MAKADYISAQKIAPDFPTVYKNWSLMEAQERHFVEAEKLIKKAFELNSDDPKIWFTWGKIDMRNDNMEEALKKYEKAYSIDNKDLYIINALGYAKCRLGLHEGANELYEKGLKISIEQQSKKNEIICIMASDPYSLFIDSFCFIFISFAIYFKFPKSALTINKDNQRLRKYISKFIEIVHEKTQAIPSFIFKAFILILEL